MACCSELLKIWVTNTLIQENRRFHNFWSEAYIPTIYDAVVIVADPETYIRQVKSVCVIAEGFAVQFALFA